MQPLQEKLRWNIDVRPLHRETGTIRFVPTSERRRAIVTCSAIMCATIGVTGYPRSASCPRRRAVALPHSRRRRAAAGSVPSPFLDGPKSVAPTTCANLRASIGVTGYPRSANCPRRRAIALPYSRRLRATAGTVPSPFLDGPKSAPPPAAARVHLCASIGVTGYPRSERDPRLVRMIHGKKARPIQEDGTLRRGPVGGLGPAPNRGSPVAGPGVGPPGASTCNEHAAFSSGCGPDLVRMIHGKKARPIQKDGTLQRVPVGGLGLAPTVGHPWVGPFFEEAALMMKLPKRHATPGRGPACTNSVRIVNFAPKSIGAQRFTA